MKEILRLTALLRRCAPVLYKTLDLTLAAGDWAIRYDIEALHDEAQAINAMFFAGETELLADMEEFGE